ncbi:MAG: response regulator transcription factor [Bacteroidales bacterium]|jgi:DNA-binding response OmpR family regulator|nr:response regulator transcription factor [Bacteroidales bacterium]
MDKARILVVDDESSLCEILKFNLEKAGYSVDTALSAEEALSLNISNYQLLLLDVMMDDISGFQMAKILKKNKATESIPIIFCTAKDTEDDTVKGLDLGADDYISKPFSLKEVIARVNAVLRRGGGNTDNAGDQSPLRYENLMVDVKGKRAFINDSEITLTKTELELLSLLLRNKGRIFSREDLLKMVWPDDVLVTARTIDVHITRLRKKIKPYGDNIVTRFGYGYCFES